MCSDGEGARAWCVEGAARGGALGQGYHNHVLTGVLLDGNGGRRHCGWVEVGLGWLQLILINNNIYNKIINKNNNNNNN